MGAGRFISLVVVAALIAAFCWVVDQPHNFALDPNVLHQAAKRGIAIATESVNGGQPSTEAVVAAVIAEVAKAYPQDVKNTGRWVFNKAGGAMGSMTVLHSSLSEYLIVFGTPLGTEGHTGRFFAEDFFMILSGEQQAALPGALSPEVYRPGDSHYLPRHTAKQYRMPESCFALEYARGNMVSMLFFGFIETFTSTLDFRTLYDTIEVSSSQIIPNLLRGKI